MQSSVPDFPATVSSTALHAGLQRKLPAARKVVFVLTFIFCVIHVILRTIALASELDDCSCCNQQVRNKQQQQKVAEQWQPTMHAPAPAPPQSSASSDSMPWAVGGWQSVFNLFHYGPSAM